MEFVKQTIAANPVVIFGKSYCPYCQKAIRFMKLTGCHFLNIDLDKREDGATIQNALHQMTGRRTVPNVFVKGQSIGGGDDTERLYNSGELQKMVEGL